MSAVGEDSFIDVVNDSDVPVGLVRRSDALKSHVTFRVAHVLIFNRKDELLVQRLALGRKRHPGYWGSSVAAYLFSNETYEMAAKRRMLEELRVEPPRLDSLGTIAMEDEAARKFIRIFECGSNGPFQIEPDHIDRVEFLPVSAILEMRALGLRSFTPTFLRVLDSYLQV